MTRKNYHHGDLKNALIRAGIDILADEGVGGLSLRKVARKAGVSHAAPYAHFADKETLIAAIATDGHNRIHQQLEAVITIHPDDPLRQFVGAAWAYVQFGLESPAHYRVTFSGVLENEHDHPEFVESSRRNMQLLKDIIERCRAAGILDAGRVGAEMQAISVWSLIHGLVLLVIQGQLPSDLIKRSKPKEMLVAALQQLVRVPIDARMLQ